MIISKQDAVRLPLHDAVIVTLSLSPAKDGFLTATLAVEINQEELALSPRELGITNPDLDLVFEACWQTKTNLMGHATGPEVISTFAIEKESALIKDLLGDGIRSQRMTHFRIEGSHGSQMDFVSETISIIEG
jgi:hypothetical protein